MNEEEIFHEALARNLPQERAAYLEQACTGNSALRASVEALLQANVGASGFLEKPASPPGATMDEAIPERPGAVIGPYKLMEQVGEGGMGLVFVAEQQHPVRRKVALKIIKPGMDTRQVVARFEAEQQALALMDHPNIAKVFGGGATTSGRPYFVMELVKGVPITQFCDENRLTPQERLELFLHVCQAVQHAHQKGIIHRDLKPSNVMVMSHDGTPVVKVIDFGVAKAIGPPLTDKTIYTQLAQLVGTPLYMSPEQAGQSGLDIDTRTDIYSLGVLLYELLTGMTPFDEKRLQTAAYDEVRRIIREEEPPKPSTRISTLGQAASTVTGNRRSDPHRLSRLFRGELDWIVMKALEKDRQRRYESASAFAADVERYLHDEPVQACPPTVAYRLRKFARRHQGPVLAGALIFLALLSAVVGTTRQAIRATHAEQQAVEDRNAAQRAEEAKTEQLWDAHLARARAGRLTGYAGRRFNGLEALDKARALLPSLPADDRRVLDLSDEYLACLSLADLDASPDWEKFPPGTAGVGFDNAFEHYARSDEKGSISVHRLADGQEIARLPAQGQPAWDPCFSPDGRFLAATYSVRYWNLPNRFLVWDWRRGEAVVNAEPSDFHGHVDFSSDSRRVAAGRIGGTIQVYSLTPDAGKMHQLAGDSRPERVAFHPDGRTLAVSCFDGVVQVRDAETGAVRAALAHPREVHAIAWQRDGKLLAVGCPADIHFWDAESWRRVAVLSGHQSAITNMVFSHDGDLLASASWDGTARLWDVEARRQLVRAATGPSNVRIRFSPDDRWLGLTGVGLKPMRWQVAAGRECRLLAGRRGLEKGDTRVGFSPDGRFLASAARGVALWDWLARRQVAYLPVASSGLPLFPPDGASALTASHEGLMRWPLTPEGRSSGTPSPVALRIGPPDPLLKTPLAEATLGADGGAVLARTESGELLVLDISRPSRSVVLKGLWDPWSVALSPDGKWAAAGSWTESKFRVWDARSGEPALSPDVEARVSFSPDGQLLVTGSGDQYRLWDVATWKLVRVIPRRPEGLRGDVAFAPGGAMMAIIHSMSLGQVHLIDPASDRVFARLQVPDQNSVVALAFSPDGAQLAASCAGDAIYIWDLRQLREHLAAKGLDWDLPPYPTPAHSLRREPLRVQVLLGQLPQAQLRLANEEFERAVAANPDDAPAQNSLAWRLATCPTPALRDPARAVALAKRAVALTPSDGNFWNTLGVAHYRAGDWPHAVTALEKSMELRSGDAHDFFFLAMARWQAGAKQQARHWFDLAVRWMEKYRPHDEELLRFRAEAEALLYSGKP